MILGNLKKLVLEIWRVYRILPFLGFMRWVLLLLSNLHIVIKSRSLGVVDDAFGLSCTVKHYGKLVRFESCAFGVIREIFGARCYVEADALKDVKQVVDLGANAGAFTLFALASNPDLKVYAVETQPFVIDSIKRNLSANGFGERCVIRNAFIGDVTTEWAREFRNKHPEVPPLDVDKFFEGLGRIDFLKCDIEGSEFGLFEGGRDWYKNIREMSIEYHWKRSDGERLEALIHGLGFVTKLKDHGSLGYVIAKQP